MENILTREEMRATVLANYAKWVERLKTSKGDVQYVYSNKCDAFLDLSFELGLITHDEYKAMHRETFDIRFPEEIMLNESPEEPEEEEDTLPFPEVMEENKPWELMDAEERADQFFSFPEETKRPEEPEEPDQQESLDKLRESVVEQIVSKLEEDSYFAMSKPWDKEILQAVHKELPECRIVVGHKTLYFVDDESLDDLCNDLVEKIEHAESEIFDYQLAQKNCELYLKKYFNMRFRNVYDFLNEEETCEVPEMGKAGA